MRFLACFFALSLLAGAAVARPAPFSGVVTGVSDGDTLVVMQGRDPVRVRLAWVDAPERGQDYGGLAKQTLAELCFMRSARVDPVDVDRYGRVVARVACDGEDAGLHLLRKGLAWAFVRYNPPQEYLQEQGRAKVERVGLWRQSSPVPPWEFRNSKRGQNAI